MKARGRFYSFTTRASIASMRTSRWLARRARLGPNSSSWPIPRISIHEPAKTSSISPKRSVTRSTSASFSSQFPYGASNASTRRPLPAIGGFTHLYRLLEAEKVIVSIPIEEMAIPLATLVDIPWIGTSNYEYLGTSVPEMLSHIRQGNLTDAMEIYWRIDPARRAAQQIAAVPGANFAHRYLWKYMAWLQGFNGGPLRAPTMRIVPKQMRGLRQGLQDSGLVPCADSDEAFFVGRHD